MKSALIVGCGKIGRTYVEALMDLGITISGVADIVSERAEKLANIASSKAYTDYKEMLRSNKSGVVCITTPTPLHREIAIAAAVSGFDVFCEKPLAQNINEAREIVNVAKTNNVKLGIGFKMRYESVFTEAKYYINNRNLGKVNYIYINHFQPLPDIEWYLDEGVIAGLLVHSMDLSNWFFEGLNPRLVKASGNYLLGRGGEDQAFLEYYYDKNSRAIITGGYMRCFPQIAGEEDLVFELICERGYVVGRRPNFLLVRDQNESLIKIVKPVNAFKKELEEFFKALIEDRKPPIDGEDGLKAQIMVDMAIKSISSNGIPVTITSE